MGWLTGALSAPPGQEGQPTTSKDFAKHPKSREAGWWFKDSLSLNHHPVCAVMDASQHFLRAQPAPPGQEGPIRRGYQQSWPS